MDSMEDESGGRRRLIARHIILRILRNWSRRNTGSRTPGLCHRWSASVTSSDLRRPPIHLRFLCDSVCNRPSRRGIRSIGCSRVRRRTSLGCVPCGRHSRIESSLIVRVPLRVRILGPIRVSCVRSCCCPLRGPLTVRTSIVACRTGLACTILRICGSILLVICVGVVLSLVCRRRRRVRGCRSLEGWHRC